MKNNLTFVENKIPMGLNLSPKLKKKMASIIVLSSNILALFVHLLCIYNMDKENIYSKCF